MAVISVNEIWEAMMFKRIDRVTILGLIALLASGSAALACGTERWPVKIGTDKDARQVATSPKLATIAQLRLIAAPATAPSNPHGRQTAHPTPAGSFLGGFRTPALSTAG
jgi:hypothetical protein